MASGFGGGSSKTRCIVSLDLFTQVYKWVWATILLWVNLAMDYRILSMLGDVAILLLLGMLHAKEPG